MPLASRTIERLMPRLPRSTGLLPAFSPPHGALVMQQSTAPHPTDRDRSSDRKRPAHHLPELLHHQGVDPLIAPTPEGGRRAFPVGDPLVGAAEDQDLNKLLKNHPIRYA